MKNFTKLAFVALLSVAMIGCGNTDEKKDDSKDTSAKAPATNKVSLDADLCGSCGSERGAADCCKGEKCDSCGMQKGSALCCTGVAPSNVVYCKACGMEKGGEKCCSDENETCTKCGLAKGSPICCKVSAHDHDDHEHGADDDHDHDHDHDNKDDDQDHEKK